MLNQLSVNKSDLVSIITPMYNSEKYIEDAINSVLLQTYINWELIIINDFSNDDSVKIVENYSKSNNKIKLIHNKRNLGPALTRNKGIEIAKGRFIAFLDSDDLWKKRKLEKQIKFMKSNNYAFTYTRYNKININREIIGIVSSGKLEVSYKDMLKTNHIGCLTAILDIHILGKKILMPNLRKRQDHGLWLIVLKDIERAYCLNETLASYRIRNDSISKNIFSNFYYQWMLYRQVESLRLTHSLYYIICYIFYGIIKNIR